MNKRTIAAFFVAPFAASLAIWLLMFVVGGWAASFWLPFMVPIAYCVAVVLGVPAHVLLKRYGWTRLWQYALAGLSIGLAPLLVIAVMPQFQGKRGVALLFLIFGAALGPIGAAVFWSIAVRSRVEHAEV
jgi:hypothetical protein